MEKPMTSVNYEKSKYNVKYCGKVNVISNFILTVT